MKKCGTFSTTVVRQATRLGMTRLDQLLTADELAGIATVGS
jgi:hypothetical protein